VLAEELLLMDKFIESTILRATSARQVLETELIQSLWKGYGEIFKAALSGAKMSSVIVKHVCLPKALNGRNSDLSHGRKVKSYRVETSWYSNWSALCDAACPVPACLAIEKRGDETVMVLEDLDETGYARRVSSASWQEMCACLSWLAELHATFLGQKPDGLWKNGTYWHLDTRPAELKALSDTGLRAAAGPIDRKLRNTFQTFVHGDAKIENFCFSADGTKVAAVDFQYVGGGCGMKDVAYFVGSCLCDEEAENWEDALLDFYFDALATAVKRRGIKEDTDSLVREWRALYPYAWTDFHRFYKGWGSVRFAKTSYSERTAAKIVEAVTGQKGRGA
jgi:aminoglycoside phosphotransferase (APT) family kinase protein